MNVSSTGYELAGVRFDDWNFKDGKDYGPWQAYAQSRTVNVLFAAALTEKLKEERYSDFCCSAWKCVAFNFLGFVEGKLTKETVVPASGLVGNITPDMWTETTQLASESSGGRFKG